MSEHKPILQSPFYLMGNKRKLMPDILPHLKGKKVLVDLFAGSGTVAYNAINNFNFERVICNDIHEQMVEMQLALKKNGWIEKCELVDKLTPKDKDGYLNLRKVYNENRQSELLYNLMMRSNNNMIRFNSSGGYNMPFGERHRFDKERLSKYKELTKYVEWYQRSFAYLLDSLDEMLEDSDHKPEDTVVYVDPPYFISTAVYNEGGGWTETEDKVLLSYLTDLVSKGYKVVYSNVLENRQRKNQHLIEWCDNKKHVFDVYHLNIDYNNSNANKGSGKTDEVLIVSKEER